MLEGEKPDGVIVCIGPEQHAVLAQTIIRKGIPVYTKKAPCRNRRGGAVRCDRIQANRGVMHPSLQEAIGRLLRAGP